jgi:cytochrome c peroxidase
MDFFARADLRSARGAAFRAVVAAVVVAASAAAQGLPSVPAPPGNPPTFEKSVLGKILFHEEQLSADDAVACATCHRMEAGGGDPRRASTAHPGWDGVYGTADDVRGSPAQTPCGPQGFVDDGVFFPGRSVTRRKAPGVVGAAWDPLVYWDGRAADAFLDATSGGPPMTGATLESQAAEVAVGTEMGCVGRSWGEVTLKLAGARPLRLATNLPADVAAAVAAHPTYPALFAWAFGGAAVTRERVAAALATYERSLVPDQTPYDAWAAGNDAALTSSQVAGLTVLVVHYCVFCHTPPVFGDGGFHNVGVRPPAEDAGRQEVTGLASDRGRFKTPTLRNVGLRAPYFHHGGAASLEDAIALYERGGDFAENRSPMLAPFALTPTERADLVDFLANGLLDPRVANGLPPFDRPTLRSELPPRTTFAGPGSPGSGGFSPQVVAPHAPVIGAPRFVVGLARAAPGAAALLLVGAPAPPGASFGPHPLGVAFDAPPLSFVATTSSLLPVDGRGYASVVGAIPEDPALDGLALAAQWAVVDPAGAFGFCVSDVATFAFFAP